MTEPNVKESRLSLSTDAQTGISPVPAENVIELPVPIALTIARKRYRVVRIERRGFTRIAGP